MRGRKQDRPLESIKPVKPIRMNRLVQERVARGLTIEKVAHLIGISPGTLRSAERRGKAPKVEFYRRLAAIYEMDWRDLVEL